METSVWLGLPPKTVALVRFHPSHQHRRHRILCLLIDMKYGMKSQNIISNDRLVLFYYVIQWRKKKRFFCYRFFVDLSMLFLSCDEIAFYCWKSESKRWNNERWKMNNGYISSQLFTTELKSAQRLKRIAKITMLVDVIVTFLNLRLFDVTEFNFNHFSLCIADWVIWSEWIDFRLQWIMNEYVPTPFVGELLFCY